MTKLRYHSLSLLLLLSALITEAQNKAYHLQFKNATELQQFLSYSDKRIPLVSAHRGGSVKGYPENAIETFEHAIQTQPLVIECDISLSKDSVLVLMHDNRLDRTSTGKGPISDYTFEQLQSFRLRDNSGDTTSFRIPKLDDALIWGRDKVIFTLDVKRGVPYAKVIEAVRRCKAESCSVIITYNADAAEEVHRLAPDLMISASIQKEEDLKRLNDKGVPDSRLVAFVGVREADKELYDLLHSRKIQCIVGVMGNLDRQAVARGDRLYYEMISHGADILSGDRAEEAGVQLSQYREDNSLSSKHIKRVKSN